jgi:glutathione S-transferase
MPVGEHAMSELNPNRIAADLQQIKARLAVLYAPDEVETWLRALHPQLADTCAGDLITQGRAAEVLKVLDRLEASAFV